MGALGEHCLLEGVSDCSGGCFSSGNLYEETLYRENIYLLPKNPCHPNLSLLKPLMNPSLPISHHNLIHGVELNLPAL